MRNIVTRGNLYNMFGEGSKMITKLNKDGFVAKEPGIRHDKEDKGIIFYFDFTKNNESGFDSFTIMVTPDREYLEKDSIELALLGLKPGVVLKKVDNDFDTFFKAFIQMRDEYIEYKGEFKEVSEESKIESRGVKERMNQEKEAMKDTLNKYI